MEGELTPESLETPCDPARYDEVRAYVERLAAALGPAPRRVRLLKYLVDRTLAGEGGQLNEYAIGIDVFEKLPSFDPRSDSMVRTDIMRLRQRLRQHYAEAGSGDPIVLDLPPRSYRVSIQFRDAALESPAPKPAAPRPRIRWMLLAAVALAAGALGVAAWLRFYRHPPLVQSLIVLPFQDFSSNHQSGYLADGLTDEITNNLANLNGLRVIARTTAFEFKGKGIDIRQIGRQLNVDACLEGSLDREGDRIRIRAQLNRSSDGYHLWSHVYDVQFRDLLAVQRDIARSISDDLQLSRSFTAAPQPVARRHDPGDEAHDLYLRGAEAWNAANVESFSRGAALFQAAVARDPDFAWAWLALANAHWNLGLFSGWKAVSAAQVESEAQRALDLDPSLASAHATLGNILWRHDYDWPRAESEFRLALQYGAGIGNVHNLYAFFVADRGRFEEAHRHLRIAEELSPLQDVLFTSDASIFQAEHRFEEAARLYQHVLARKPAFAIALTGMATLKLAVSDCAGAAPYATRLTQASPGSRYADSVNWYLAVCRGERTAARKLLDGAPSIPLIDRAAGYAALGDKDRAMECLRKSADLREIGVTGIKYSLAFESLRSDPRFLALEREIGLLP